MNLNNLEDLKNEVKSLGFSPKLADDLEKNMRNMPSYFTLKDQLPGDKGQVELTLHFNKSNQSDFYSFSKYDVAAGKVPPTPDNQVYMVISENKENKGKPLVKEFQSPNEAIDFFKKQKGNSELALGESADSKQTLASKENGNVNYLNNDFRPAYSSPAVKQTVYVDKGHGFSASQAANLVQDRTVYRDDLMTRVGDPYKAWVRLDFDQPKDQYNNHKLKQFHDPSYGFNLEKAVNQYNIKDLAEPAKKEAILQGMRNGDRVAVTAVGKDNKEVKVFAQAVPRYGKLDFFNEKGIGQKREQFEKTNKIEQTQVKGQVKAKEPEVGKSLSVR